jgi:hypothetical protein
MGQLYFYVRYATTDCGGAVSKFVFLPVIDPTFLPVGPTVKSDDTILITEHNATAS